ncbi:Fe(3+) dicitrate ABC transporter substrate-binding protein [Marinomonas transparens]|uniref:ABC transporter substrate-binding protein n=1 Tax=Marinomonas transparens TaxID=2795388 RepID=A0A934JVP0_9GAMM|nr:Fe(3+) dicitrate ABC transporter substrate-binding protein [Marinomonas transparens]MBJ7537882.1 ABC transporter substrate-binding protein [Marinomonas transparens]
MTRFSSYVITCVVLLFSVITQATTVQDSKGTFTIDYQPKRIIVLEFSFADALAAVNVSPIGIADDKDPTRVLKDVRDIIGDWTSVGTRSQPSLEVIASLKPDLIIADIARHEAVYKDLQKIAPTLILPSRRETYEGSLKAAGIIGKVVGKDSAMQTRLQKHKTIMMELAKQLPHNAEVQFGVARDDALFLHTADSYAGGVIRALGLTNAETGRDDSAYRQTGLEQLVAINPEYLLIGHYVTPSIIDKWQNEPLWSVLKVARNKHLYKVNPNVWSKSRGIVAAERMGQDLIKILNAK